MKRRNRFDYQRRHDTNRGHCVSGFDFSRIALLDKNSRQLVEEKVREVDKIETAVQKDFQQLCVDAMPIPHQSDVFTKEGQP